MTIIDNPPSEEELNNFVSITGCNLEQAKFFLESSNNDSNAAVSAFFDSGGSIGEEFEETDMLNDEDDEQDDDMGVSSSVPVVAAPTPIIPSSSGGGRTLGGGGSSAGAYPTSSNTPRVAAPSISANWGSTSSSSSSSRSSTPINPFRSNQGPRVSTLRDLNSGSAAPPARGAPGSDDEEDDQLEFFTGGEKSGLSVENPNARKGKGASDMVKGILAKAQAGGAAVAAAAAQGRSVFSGAAHTLGSDETPSSFIPDPSRSARVGTARAHMPGTFQSVSDDEDEGPGGDEGEIAVRHLHFFSDGFCIDDGDCLPYDVPANQDLLTALNTGRAPLSVLNVVNDQRVELRIAKRQQEKWSRQAPAEKGPFEGSGNRLGDASSTSTFAPPISTPAVSSSSSTSGTQTISLSDVFEVNSAEPVTTLQIRLRDGTRMIAKFNHTHTVGDIRRYINASNPGQSNQNYVLMTTFPSKDLDDEKLTLKDANLLGSVVVQRGV